MGLGLFGEYPELDGIDFCADAYSGEHPCNRLAGLHIIQVSASWGEYADIHAVGESRFGKELFCLNRIVIVELFLRIPPYEISWTDCRNPIGVSNHHVLDQGRNIKGMVDRLSDSYVFHLVDFGIDKNHGGSRTRCVLDLQVFFNLNLFHVIWFQICDDVHIAHP